MMSQRGSTLRHALPQAPVASAADGLGHRARFPASAGGSETSLGGHQDGPNAHQRWTYRSSGRSGRLCAGTCDKSKNIARYFARLPCGSRTPRGSDDHRGRRRVSERSAPPSLFAARPSKRSCSLDLRRRQDPTADSLTPGLEWSWRVRCSRRRGGWPPNLRMGCGSQGARHDGEAGPPPSPSPESLDDDAEFAAELVEGPIQPWRKIGPGPSLGLP